MTDAKQYAATEIRDLLYGRLLSHALCGMAGLRIADHLAAGPLPVSERVDLSGARMAGFKPLSITYLPTGVGIIQASVDPDNPYRS